MEEPNDSMVGGFKILANLKAGSGAQGTVYKAICERDDLPFCPRGTVVALKAMPVSGDDPDSAFEKLRRRTDLLKSISHPNIVRYFGCFSAQLEFAERHFIVLEFLEGETLAQKLQKNRAGLDADEAIRIVKGMVAGLAAAENAGIVHRDVKPGNVFVCENGEVKLIDFEISRNTSRETASSGNMLGSYDYMAPDFTDPDFSGDAISDIFSAGVVMHEALCGDTPYKRLGRDSGKSSFEFLERWTRDSNGDFTHSSCRVSSGIERTIAHAKPVLSKALALRREDRFATFAEFEAALGTIRMRELRNGSRRYRILQLVGRGGFGEVFKVRCEGKVYAVKHLLKLQYATRFFREAKIMSELKDPCFVQFFDFFILEHAGERDAFLVMDFLPGMPGSSLRDAIRASAGAGIEFESVIKAFMRYAHGLRVIHERGIYHRDIKPTNLYFPPENPEKAAIMDLGIARDEKGTETSGQVPGTLDYMPPETALGQARGDSGMDIYALGLCLYEALTGKKGYPKLPSGSAGLAQFFQRAKDKVRPDFSDERVTSRPQLLDLLVRMTEPDPAKRIQNAAEVGAVLRTFVDSDAGVPETTSASTFAPTISTGATVAEDSDTGDGETMETVFVEPENAAKQLGAAMAKKPPKDKKKAKKKKAKASGEPRKSNPALMFAALFVTVISLMVISVQLFREQIDIVVDKFVRYISPPPSNDVERSLVDKMDIGIDDLYGDDSNPIAECDKIRDEYLAARRPPILTVNEYARIQALLDEQRKKRVIRDSLLDERDDIDREADAVARAYDEEGIVTGDVKREDWLHIWGESPKDKVEAALSRIAAARARREKYDEANAKVPAAEAAARIVKQKYDEVGITIGDKEFEIWKAEWHDAIPPEDYNRIVADVVGKQNEIRAKQNAQDIAMEAKSTMSECRALMQMITPVQQRMSRLSEAEIRSRAAYERGILTEEQFREIATEIIAYRRWVVFEVVNCSNIDVEIDGRTIGNGESDVFVYTNAPPQNLAATHKGYEPFPLGRQTNGKVLRLLPEYFELLKVPVTVGEIPRGVVCRVDGVPVRAKTLHLMPGTHECVYSRIDYKNQTMPFRVEIATPATLPRPGAWQRSESYEKRELVRNSLSSLISAEMAADGGDWDRAKALVESLPDYPDGDARVRKETLTRRIEQARRFIAKADEAAKAFMDENWRGVVDVYSALAAEGYLANNEDIQRMETAARNLRDSLEMKVSIARRNKDDAAKAKAESDMAKLDNALKAIKRKQ